MSTPERIEELNAKSEKCPHGLYGVCYFCGEHARKVRICGWGALAWIIASLLALCAFAVLSCNAADLDSRFYDTLAQVESGNRNVPGDHGRSVGPYQFTAKAWEQANKLRTKAMLPIGAVKPLPYALAHDLRMATLMAEYYCGWLESGLTRTLHRKPSIGEIYCAYNLGPKRFHEYGDKIKNVPAATRDAAKRMENLCK